jgi:predicted nucleotidyltransferase
MTQKKLARILKELREGLSKLLGEHLEAVYLYGSQARGDARPDSDIDVLVVLRGEFDFSEMHNRTIDLVAALSLENDAVITCVFVTKAQYEHEVSPFLLNVRREAIQA